MVLKKRCLVLFVLATVFCLALAPGCTVSQGSRAAGAGALGMPENLPDRDAVSAVVPAFDAVTEQAFAKSGVPGMAVAVVKDDRVVYLRCFGVRNITTQEPVTPHTRFQLASISKSFTAATVASMVGDGTVSWDDPVSPLIRGFRLADPYVTEHVTFRDLLSHRTGLPAYAGDELQDIGYDRSEIIGKLSFITPEGQFRSHYAYSNIGITLAAEAAANKAGIPWEDLVARRIFIPAGMGNTSARFSDFENATDRADTYPTKDGTPVAGPLLNDDVNSPAGGVSSTITDMARYARLQANGGTIDTKEVVNRTALEETHRPQNIMKYTNTSLTAYGLGWETVFENGRARVEHGGDLTSGVSTYITIWPDEKMAIVVLTNAFPQGHIVKKTVNRYWEDLYFTGAVQKDWYGIINEGVIEALKPGASVAGPLPELPPAPADAKAPRELASYTGTYSQDYYGTVRIDTDGTALLAYPGHLAEPITIVPYNGDTFRETTSDTSVDFGFMDPGAATEVYFAMFDKPWADGTFERV